jgi:single-strand DNA-binding protein
MATNEGRKNAKGEWESVAEWHNVVVWGNRAEGLSRHVKKGTGLLVVGKMRTRKWEDDHNQTHYMTEVHADEVHFVGGRRDDAGGGKKDQVRDDHDDHYDDNGGGQATGGADHYDEDVPF